MLTLAPSEPTASSNSVLRCHLSAAHLAEPYFEAQLLATSTLLKAGKPWGEDV